MFYHHFHGHSRRQPRPLEYSQGLTKQYNVVAGRHDACVSCWTADYGLPYDGVLDTLAQRPEFQASDLIVKILWLSAYKCTAFALP